MQSQSENQWLIDAQNFLSSIAKSCKQCLRRGTSSCRNCAGQRANELVARMNDHRVSRMNEDEYDRMMVKMRCQEIIKQLSSKRRPMKATEIKLSNTESKYDKAYALRKLIGEGEIERIILDENKFYQIKETKNENQCAGIGECEKGQDGSAGTDSEGSDDHRGEQRTGQDVNS